MARRSKTPLLTKKYYARQERELIQRRAILITTIVVVTIVVGLIGYGLIDQYIIQPNRTVVRVANDNFSAKEFQSLTHFNGQNILNNYIQNVQFAQALGYDSSFIESLQSQARSSLDVDVLGNQTVNQIVDDLLIRQEAERRGIKISEEEYQKELQAQFGYFPDGTPTPEPTFPTIPTSTLSATQLAFFPPTPTTTPTEVIEEPLTATATATIEPTATQELTPTPILSPTPDQSPTPTLTPTEYTAEQFQSIYKEVIASYEENKVPEATIRWIIESQLYRQKVNEAVLAELNLETSEEQVWARHILVTDEETALQVLDRLNAGESFSSLAQELSTDTGSAQQGGDLGWFGQEVMVMEFEEVAFRLSIGEISSPVQSSFGWHIIQVLGREVRVLSESEFNQRQDQAFQEWLDTLRQATEIEINDFWRQVVPVITLPSTM
jgi:peptidyl-prolyl cis-trans isomerase D